MMISGVNAGSAMQVGRHAVKKGVQSVQGDSKAATFQHQGISDYKDKQLNPLQENIVKLQDQIAKLQNNEKLDKETKDEMLENLNKQLEDMIKQLNDSQEKKDEEENALSVKPKKKNEQNASSDPMASMYGMGAQLDQVKSMGSMKVKMENQAKLEQNELDHAVNHPSEALRLKDESIIERRQGSIDKMENASEVLGNMMAEQVNKTSQPAVAQPSENEEAEGKDFVQKDEKAEQGNIDKTEKEAE